MAVIAETRGFTPAVAQQNKRIRLEARRKGTRAWVPSAWSAPVASPALHQLRTLPGAWYDAKDTVSTAQQVASRIDATHLAVRGATTSVEASDPVFLDHTGEHYVWMPLTTADNVSTTSPWVADPGAMSARVDTDGLSGANVSGQRRVIDASVTLSRSGFEANLSVNFRMSNGETTSAPSVTFTGFDASTLTGRHQFRVDTSGTPAAGVNVTLYTRASGDLTSDTGWTNRGTVALSGVTAGHVWTPLTTARVGAATSNSPDGRVWRARLSQANSAAVRDFYPARDITTISATGTTGQLSWVSATGETWTVNRGTTGSKTAVVTRPTWLLGSNRYLQLPAANIPSSSFTATTGKYTLILAFRAFGLSSTFGRIFSSESATAQQGLRAYVSSTTARNVAFGVKGATTEVLAGAGSYIDGAINVIAVVIDEGTFSVWNADTPGSFLSSTSMTGIGTITSAAPRLGLRADTTANAFEGAVLGARLVPGSALTLSELTAIAAELRAGTYA